MPAEAHITPIWKKQKLFVSLFLIAIGLWFFVDGKWTWPRSNVRWVEYKKFEGDKRLGEWPAFAKANGWKEEPPHKLYEKDEILLQFVLGSLAAGAGAATLFYWLMQKQRIVKTESDAVISPAGTRIPFSAITGLGLKKWESKGIARVRYKLEGKRGEFILDDYKFDRDPTHEILKEIETHLLARPQS